MTRKAASNDQYRLIGTYERLRRSLLEMPCDGRLEKALSYWVLPTDRRLPIAFLDRSLDDLLKHTLNDLMETPGVGNKKILGFFQLLRRVAKADPNKEPFGLVEESASHASLPVPHNESGDHSCFEASGVSEALWATWCETIRRSDMVEHHLGRLAPSLRSLPTVIWRTPLSAYVDLSLTEIRQLRTHGEKRVHAIMEVFCTVYEAVSTAALHENLDIEVVPRFVPCLSRWLTANPWHETPPSLLDVRERVVQPLLHQIEIDLDETVAALAAERVRVDQDAPSVKAQADALGVTRARVYQLLEDCGKVMDVRWPEGRWLLAPLLASSLKRSSDAAALLGRIIELFYPQESSERNAAIIKGPARTRNRGPVKQRSPSS